MQTTAPVSDRPTPSTPLHTLEPKSPSETEDPELSAGFDFTLVEPFAKSVKEAIGWKEAKEAPP